MSKQQNRSRARRKLIMSDENIETLINDGRSTDATGRFNSSWPETRKKGHNKFNLENEAAESVITTFSTPYNLRELPKRVYCNESKDEEDFSPDESEYLPSPERRQQKLFGSCSSLDSDFIEEYVKKIPGTPSTVSNISGQLVNNVSFIASQTEIFLSKSYPNTPKQHKLFSPRLTNSGKSYQNIIHRMSSTPKHVTYPGNTNQKMLPNVIKGDCIVDIKLKSPQRITPYFSSTHIPNRQTENTLLSLDIQPQFERQKTGLNLNIAETNQVTTNNKEHQEDINQDLDIIGSDLPKKQIMKQESDFDNYSENNKLNISSITRTYNLMIEIEPWDDASPVSPSSSHLETQHNMEPDLTKENPVDHQLSHLEAQHVEPDLTDKTLTVLQSSDLQAQHIETDLTDKTSTVPQSFLQAQQLESNPTDQTSTAPQSSDLQVQPVETDLADKSLTLPQFSHLQAQHTELDITDKTPTIQQSPELESYQQDHVFETMMPTNVNITNDDDYVVVIQVVDSDDENPSTSMEPKKIITRKRPSNKNEWQDQKAKRLKNSGDKYTACRSKKEFEKKKLRPECNCKKNCGLKFSHAQREAILQTYYELGDHERQWDFILRHTEAENIKRMKIERRNNRTQTIKYFFRINSTKIQVCRQFFVNTLSISNQTIYTALEKAQGTLTDNRGKHENRPRKMSIPTEESILQHINLFPAKESHYIRKDSNRSYLSELLNISKMYRLYQDWFKTQNFDCEMASKRQYQTIFNTKFNLSFFKPKKDQCSTCTLFQQADISRQAELNEKYQKHIANKERVREIKREEKKSVDKTKTTVAVFDLEKVLTIPQSPVGIFHYKRKYPVYNFTVYDTTRSQGYCYVWHYQIAKRGSIEIGSCLLQFIKSELQKGIKEISFYSDGCGGQNKNRFVFALYIYLTKKFDITITHRFFETGHSQSEGDSMHSTVETALKHRIIYTPDQIYGIIINAKVTGSKYNVKEMTQSDFYDIKELVSNSNWVKDESGKKILWSKVMEVRASHAHPDVLYFKYDFNAEYSILQTTTVQQTETRTVSRRRMAASTSSSSMQRELKQAYNRLIPISRALFNDLMSLCDAEAIPAHYHGFYKSLSFTEVTQRDENQSDHESESN